MKRLPEMAVAALAVCLDQASKYWAENFLPLQEAVPVMPMVSLFRTHNTGIAFSFFSSMPDWALIAFTLGIVVVVAVLWRKLEYRRTLAGFGFALIVGGAIGNLVDRVLLGHVVDFILFHSRNWSFAIFNLADSFITVGAGLIVLDEILELRRNATSGTTE